jgi:muramidase (phage lysozyme)
MKKKYIIKIIPYKCLFFIFIINFNFDIEFVFSLLKNKKIRGFLDVIALCEGTKLKNYQNEKPTLYEYKVSFINAETINDMTKYPNKLFCGDIRHGRVCASAAGRYQFIKKTWNRLAQRIKPETLYKKHPKLFEDYFQDLSNLYEKDIVTFYKNPLDLIKYKFGPFWQDFYAIILMLEKKDIIDDILNQNYKKLIYKASQIWSTFPKNAGGKSFYESNINHAQKLNYVLKICKKYIKNN